MKILLRKVWKNYIDDQVVNPLKLFKPETLADLIAIVTEAEGKGLKVKAVGSGHSSTDILLTRDYLVDTHRLKAKLDINSLTLKPGVPTANLYFTECGIRVHDLNTALDKEGKALKNMGAYTGQTIAGVISTSTHGSGIKFGSLSTIVRAIILVDERGEVYHIEPQSNGISAASANLGKVKVNFIADDDVFNSVAVSMGCMGIIYAVVIEVRDKFFITENRRNETWETVKQELTAGVTLKQFDHYEILVNPYTVKGQKNCMVTERMEDPAGRPSRIKGHRSKLAAIVIFIFSAKVVHRFLKFLYKNFSSLTPTLINMEMNSLRDTYTNKSYKIFDLGTINKLGAFAMEIAFPQDTYIGAIEEIIHIAEDSVTNGKQYLTSSFSLRFVKTTELFLAMQYFKRPDKTDDYVCMIEFPTLSGAIGGLEVLERIEDTMYDFGGVPHWGQVNHVGNSNNSSLSKLYPRFNDWLKTYRRFNKLGTFENDFTERCGITVE